MATATNSKSTLTVTMTMTIRDLGVNEARILRDLILNGDRKGSMVSENYGLYDYEQIEEKVEDAVIS